MQIGIQMGAHILTDDGSDITEKEMDDFFAKFLDLVVSFGWGFGGGYRLVDVDEEEDEED